MRAHLRTIISLACLALALVPIFSLALWQEVGVALYWPGLFVLQLCLVTWPWRTVPLRLVLGAFLLGAGPVMALTLLVQLPLVALLRDAYAVNYFFYDILGQAVDTGAVIVAPLSEELLKILPLIVILSLGPWRHLRYSGSPLDFALLGAAVGAGFQLVETIWQGIVAIDMHSYARLAEHISPHLGSLYALPTLVWQDGDASAWFGHAGVTATLALAIGLALRLGARRGVWWLLPAGVAVVVTLEHLLSNLGEPSAFWLQAFAFVDLRGILSSLLFTAGMVWAAVLSARILRRYRSADPPAAFGLLEAARATVAHPARLPTVLLLLRLNRAVAYGLDWFGHSRARPRPVALALHGLRETSLALQQLVLSLKAA